MRKLFFLTLLVMFFSFSANATSTLIFSGEDYEIQAVISDSAHEEIVTVNFGGPDQKNLVALMPRDFSRIKIDCDRQKLLLVFKNPGNKDLPPSFKVCARKDKAYIKIDGKKTKLKSDWIR